MKDKITITRIQAWLLDIPLLQPYSVAYESYDKVQNVLVRVETADGVTGWGCASPDEHVTGETIEDTVASVKEEIAPALPGAGESDFNSLIGIIAGLAPGAPAARAAFDIALHDIAAQKKGVPLARMFGTPRRSAATSITIGISDLEETLSEAQRRVGEGFKILKVKGGASPEEDILRIKSLHEKFPSVELWLDANQGYSAEETLRVGAALSGMLEFIEQPVAAKDMDAMSKLARECAVPVMADETVITLEDARAALAAGIKLVNVKLMKTGGLAEAVRICDAVHAAGAGAMIGCMDELPVSMAAAAHLALSHPAVKYADLDGHLDLDQDIASCGLDVKDGNVSVSETETGLGVSVDIEKLSSHTSIL